LALADYFQRSAVAAAQILSGFDQAAIQKRLEDVRVGVVVGDNAARFEGVCCAEMAVRILARLYPKLRIEGPDVSSLFELATEINPNIEIVNDESNITLCIGDADGGEGKNHFVGSSGWDAHYSPTDHRPIGESNIPFGAGVAACLGAAAVFRAVFVDDADSENEVTFSSFDFEPSATTDAPTNLDVEIPSTTVLVGVGAIGHGALWALARSGVDGELDLVDHDVIELGNLQRYALTKRNDVDRTKVELAAEQLPSLTVNRHAMPWAEFAAANGYRWEHVLVALDNAADRRAVQDALPRWVANGWTQPGDFGVSVHPWTEGACLACLYLQKGEGPSEDEQVAAAFGLPAQRDEFRRLLVGNEPTPGQLLAEAAAALQIDPEPLMAFEGRTLREIYVEGICGGAAVPLDRVGVPAADVHVPLAHQSTMAGILLAARLFREVLGRSGPGAEATRIDLLRPLGTNLTNPVAKDGRGICICQDPVFQAVYSEKWGDSF
jgi:hypothetical protein